MKPSGTFLKEWLGEKVYTIGMTAFQGQEGFAMGGPRSPIPPAPAGSLEARLHALDYPFAFLDFRAAERERPNPLRSRLTVRIPKFETIQVPDVGRIYDGIFFVDQMSAATHA